MMVHRTIEQELLIRGKSFIQTVGVSMEPILHNRKSTVVIEKKNLPLKKYDVVLYHVPTGEYVLHRIIKVMDGKYLIRGDNCISKENIPEEWIIGVMVGYYENEDDKYVSCQSKTYRRYLKTLKIRHLLLMRWYLLNFIKSRLRNFVYKKE